MKSKTSLPNGYTLHETDNYAVIATLHSENVKTGDMVQVWILHRHESPVEAVRSGNDSVICGDCPHRGNGFKDRTCYVNVAQGPGSVWRAYRNGKYPHLSPTGYADVFSGRRIRFGAYGEPVLIPFAILRALALTSDGWTGYTHQWRKAEYAGYGAYLMASCDSARDASEATANGWRYFRVRSEFEALAAGEISCPASDEAGKRTTCEKCRLCSGAREVETRKNISIIVHGSGAKNFVPLTALAA